MLLLLEMKSPRPVFVDSKQIFKLYSEQAQVCRNITKYQSTLVNRNVVITYH